MICARAFGTYGGYGGSSGVTVGLGSAKAIGSTHTYSIIADPRSTHCSPRNNLYREHKHAIQNRIEEATGKQIFNVDGFGNVHSKWSVFGAGHYSEIQEPMWRQVDEERIVKLPTQVDAVIAGCGLQTTYDSSNNPLAVLASQVSSHPLKDYVGKPFLRKGGVFIVDAPCDGRISEARRSDQEVIKIFNKEGSNAANLVDYEDEFYNREDYLFKYRHEGFPPNSPLLAILQRPVGSRQLQSDLRRTKNPDAARSVGMIPAKDFDSAWVKATEILGETEPLTMVLPNRTKRGGVIFRTG